jgi:non-ribosomal peptide synthetase component F
LGLALLRAVTNTAIHRVIEQRAALRGGDIAIVDGKRHITYRELNQGANALARRLMAHGFRRGAHASVCMPHGADLAFMLLAVLKNGGSYMWTGESVPEPDGISVHAGHAGGEDRYLHVDASALLRNLQGAASPNLPVVTRGSDIACVLRDVEGNRLVHVPHDALTALQDATVAAPAAWSGEPGALDLWVALMTGRTVVVEDKPLEAAA